jgi:hypothetical protein
LIFIFNHLHPVFVKHEIKEVLKIKGRKFGSPLQMEKQEFRRTDFGSRLLAAEGEGAGGSEGAEDRYG